jgi:hypothetical protein
MVIARRHLADFRVQGIYSSALMEVITAPWRARFIRTLWLVLLAWLIAAAVAVPGGIWTGRRAGGTIGWAAPDSGEYGVLLDGYRCCLEPSLCPDGLAIVFVSTDPSDPGTVCIADLDTGAELRLPRVDIWLDHQLRTRTTQVTALRHDGVRLEAWLTLPDDSEADPPPLVVSIHGGPHYPVGHRRRGGRSRYRRQSRRRHRGQLRRIPQPACHHGERLAANRDQRELSGRLVDPARRRR